LGAAAINNAHQAVRLDRGFHALIHRMRRRFHVRHAKATPQTKGSVRTRLQNDPRSHPFEIVERMRLHILSVEGELFMIRLKILRPKAAL
jgi:hypothetical protein